MAPFRFRRRNKSTSSRDSPPPPSEIATPYEPYFGEVREGNKGAKSSRTKESLSVRENGEQVLLRFIKNRLGMQAEGFVTRLLNKNPIKEGGGFSYQIHQSTEESDMHIVSRDLLSGRLYRAGAKYVAAPWTNLLFGDKFSSSGSRKQVHELTYVRTTCTCLVCLIRMRNLKDNEDSPSEEDVASLASTASSYTPENSAMANFVRPFALPSANELKSVGGLTSWRELEIGTIIRLNSRSAAKLRFTEDMKQLFSHLCYTGPISHEMVYRKVTTIGVNYYLYNKGKKERKVYLQGDLVQLPLEMGVVKLGTRPLRLDEVGAFYIMYRRQVLKIYVGELVLEGNSFGSFIPTGIKFFIGVGEEGGCARVYPDHSLGTPRRMGVNELLLHHHMVDDLKVFDEHVDGRRHGCHRVMDLFFIFFGIYVDFGSNVFDPC